MAKRQYKSADKKEKSRLAQGAFPETDHGADRSGLQLEIKAGTYLDMDVPIFFFAAARHSGPSRRTFRETDFAGLTWKKERDIL